MSNTGPTRPILQVEIDDSQLNAFKAKFDQAQAEANGMAGSWRSADEVISKVQKRYEEMRQVAEETAEAQGLTSKHSKDTADAFTSTIQALSGAAIWSGRAGRNIHGATLDLARWVRLTETFSGILGAGGLFGINLLAARTAERRMQAAGIGISVGAQSAFQIDYGRLGNTDALLRGFSDAVSDVNKRQPLVSLGIDPRGKDAARLFSEALPRIKRIIDAAPKGMLANTLKPYNLDQLGVDDHMARVIASMNDSQIQEMIASFKGDSQRLQIDDKTLSDWASFTTTVQRAKATIGTAIAENLVNIEPGLDKLSVTVLSVFGDLLGEQAVYSKGIQVGTSQGLGGNIIAAANNALLDLSGWMSSKEHRNDIDSILQNLKLSKGTFSKWNTWMGSSDGITKLTLLASAAAAWSMGGVGAIGAVGAGVMRYGATAFGAVAPYVAGPAAALLGATAESTPGAGISSDPVVRAQQAAEIKRLTDAYNANRGHHEPGDLSNQKGYSTVAPKRPDDPFGNLPDAGFGGTAPPVTGDISSESTYRRQNEHVDPAAFIVHHTGGTSSPEGVMATLNQRGLGVQYIMDRDGSVYRALPDGSRGAHILPGDIDGLHLSNANTIGMEVVARDDKDITPAEVAASRRFFAGLEKEYPGIKVYGHGEVNPGHKEATEGHTITEALRADQADRLKTASRPAMSLPHPNSRPAQAQSVEVRDNTGGSATVVVAH